MPDHPIVLVGDVDGKRRAAFGKIEQLFDIRLFFADTFEELKGLAKTYSARTKIVALSTDLPHSESVKQFSIEGHLQQISGLLGKLRLGAQIWLIRGAEDVNLSPAAPPVTGVWPLREDDLFRQFHRVVGAYRRLPDIKADDGDEILLEQILGLNEDRDLDAAKKVIAEIAAQFVNWPLVWIGRMTQGLSGAQVFKMSSAGEEYVLKLMLRTSGSAEDWKIRSESDLPPDVPGNIQGVKMHIPRLVAVQYPRTSDDKIAFAKDWAGICYAFLGGHAMGSTLDLHAALTKDPPPHLLAAGITSDFRRMCLENVLHWLREKWYSKVEREQCVVWDRRDADKDRYPTYPPYRLSGRNKALGLSFLASEEASLLGPRLIQDWSDHKRRVWGFLSGSDLPTASKTEVSPPWHARELKMVFGPAHGDFNARNVLLWERDLKHPFLIDFPMYQTRGHALQDFARMEIDIKVQLMDQQVDTPKDRLRALAWTWDQIELWQRMESHLLTSDASQALPGQNGCGFRGNVDLALLLIQQIRDMAREIQEDGKGSDCPTFWEEYRLPLIFHTLRMIGYQVPIFKRLVSVFSASEILNQMQRD